MDATVLPGNTNVANRLDRLPISSIHYIVLFALAFAYFFELGDISTFSFAAPALIKYAHMTIATISFITSATFFGMFIGAVSGGWVADKLGRKPALIAAIGCYTLFSLLNALAWDPVTLGVTRFLTGIGLASMTIIANTYISEFFPAASRGRFQSWTMVFGLIGIPATAWFARFVVPLSFWSWRLVFVWGALGAIALVFVIRMYESPRWYETHGMSDQAEETMRQIETRVSAEKGALPPPAKPVPQPVIHTVPYGELLRGKYLRRTVILLVAWIFQTLGFYGFQAWVPTLLAQHGFSIASSLTFTSIIQIGAPLGALLAVLIVERIDRKWSITMVAVLIAICGLLYGLTFQPVLIIVFGFLVAFFLQTFAPLLYAYTPELYPTEARASGTGLTYGVGRLANVIGPIIVGALFVSSGYLSVFVYIAACWILVALAVGIFGPLANRRNLEMLSESAMPKAEPTLSRSSGS
ncbi:MAG TPA: MFS transporter [Ktedonobacteraceae bacterium]